MNRRQMFKLQSIMLSVMWVLQCHIIHQTWLPIQYSTQYWTIATGCSACQKRISTCFSEYSTLQLGWSVTGTYQVNQIKPVLTQRHWLCIRARVTFKIATIITHQSSHLADLIEEYKLQGTLRPSSQPLLEELTFQIVTGRHSFRYVAAKTWNSFAEATSKIDTLESFWLQMKTILFRQLYYTTWIPCFRTHEAQLHYYMWQVTN